MHELVFLKIRLAQAFRELKALGFLYALILCAGIVVMHIFFYKTQISSLNALYGVCGLTIIAFMIQMGRNDHKFVLLAVENPKLVYFLEYSVMTAPLIILSIIGSSSPIILFTLISYAFISFIKKGIVSQSDSTKMENFLPNEIYEWKAGIRKSGWLFFIMWLFSFLLAFVPFASMILLWFLLMITSSFYEDGESREMVESFRLDERKFLNRKIKIHAKAFLILACPVLIVSAFFFPDRWWILLLFAIFGCINILVFVISKYAFWQHGTANKSNSLLNTICMVSFFLPFLIPLPIFILIRNYRKAIHNLQPLLHDYH